MSRPGPAGVAKFRRAPAGLQPFRQPVPPIHDLGEGRLEPGIPEGRPQKVLRLDVTGAPPNLLGRLLIGSYITGQDQVLVTARNGLTPSQRREIRQAADRILGMTVVSETGVSVEVQNFIDPAKHELPHLLHRVVQMLRAELEVCSAVLAGEEIGRLAVIDDIEQEVDRFYILMVRQLLLSSENPRIARNIDVPSHHYQIGDRLVAKVLEVIGDLIHGIGVDLQGNLAAMRRASPPVVREFVNQTRRLERLLARTMEAFGHLSMVEANALLNTLTEVLPKEGAFEQVIAHQLVNGKAAVAAQRIACNLDMALEMLVIVNEVTINRSVEPVTEWPIDVRSASSARPSRRPSRSTETTIAILSPK